MVFFECLVPNVATSCMLGKYLPGFAFPSFFLCLPVNIRKDSCSSSYKGKYETIFIGAVPNYTFFCLFVCLLYVLKSSCGAVVRVLQN